VGSQLHNYPVSPFVARETSFPIKILGAVTGTPKN
jgi:hypothetical protein